MARWQAIPNYLKITLGCMLLGIAVFTGLVRSQSSTPARTWTLPEDGKYRLVAVWAPNDASQQLLKAWTLNDLSEMPAVSSREADPSSGHRILWRGVLFSDLIDDALKALPAETRAQIDLVILKGKSGRMALVPRSLITRYPWIIALGKGGEDLSDTTAVAPWTSHPEISREDFSAPIQNFFVSDLSEMEFSNYHDRYQSLFLKRRTDPFAMRGEKIFVQNCLSCHAVGQGPSVTELLGAANRNLASAGHANVRGASRLSARDLRALESYWKAYRSENSITASRN